MNGTASFKILVSMLVCACPQIVACEKATVIGTFQLPPTSLQTLGSQPFDDLDLARAKSNGLESVNLPSIGSGLVRVSENEYAGISDRGPNGEAGGQRTFPLPKFCPFITRFKLNAGKIEIQSTLLLSDDAGKPFTGLSNQEGEEQLYESADAIAPLRFDPNGVDPEAIRVFPDGSFLISEEYSPSLMVVNTNGQVLVRYVPANKPLPGATCPVRAILPPVLAQRRTNRGFEALALSPDGRTAYVMLQSPLGDEDDLKFKRARVSRTLRLDMSDPLNARVTGHFLMPLSCVTNHSAGLKQSSVKLNDAEWLGPDKLLVLEQFGRSALLLVADFSAADNLAGNPIADTTIPEAAGDDLSRLPCATAAVKTWANINNLADNDTKLEGMAVVSPTEITIANDNDFGIGNGKNSLPSTVWILRLSQPLPISPGWQSRMTAIHGDCH